MEINNKVAIITGGANGIGKACALDFIKEGATVVIADIDEENGKITEQKLGKNCLFKKVDITNENDVIKLKDFIMNEYGRIDILINNAAKQTEEDFFEMKPSVFKCVVDTNLNGTFICSSILGKEMQSGGKIINMLSVHYNKPRKNKYHYDASKAGVAMLTKEMALAFDEKGITVNAISYGACYTPMNKDWLDDEKLVKRTLDRIPLRWIAKPEEISSFVINILKNFSEYTTGSIFNIDGGRELTS